MWFISMVTGRLFNYHYWNIWILACSVTSGLNIYMDICENAHVPGIGWQVDSSTITITMSKLLMLGDTWPLHISLLECIWSFCMMTDRLLYYYYYNVWIMYVGWPGDRSTPHLFSPSRLNIYLCSNVCFCMWGDWANQQILLLKCICKVTGRLWDYYYLNVCTLSTG